MQVRSRALSRSLSADLQARCVSNLSLFEISWADEISTPNLDCGRSYILAEVSMNRDRDRVELNLKFYYDAWASLSWIWRCRKYELVEEVWNIWFNPNTHLTENLRKSIKELLSATQCIYAQIKENRELCWSTPFACHCSDMGSVSIQSCNIS